jgi:pilus assembly protein CpaB
VSIRTLLIVVLALVFGGSAAVGINKMRGPQTVVAPETVAVVVAAVDIPPFTTVTAQMLKTQDFPKNLVPPGSLTSLEEAVDRVTHGPVGKDETILNSKLAVRGAGRGMAASIPIGKRAFTIQTPSISAGVAGFILPGNKVDVLLTVTRHGTNEISRTVTLLESVEIKAVDQRVEAPAENKVDVKELRSVTLLVTPDQANWLTLAQKEGVLHLSLRNPQDKEPAKAHPVTLKDLGVVDEKPREAVPAVEKVEKKKEEKAEDLVIAPTVVKPPPAPKPPPPVRIRTLRGSHEGRILITPEQDSPR